MSPGILLGQVSGAAKKKKKRAVVEIKWFFKDQNAPLQIFRANLFS